MFIGQKRILNELSSLIGGIQGGLKANLLLLAPSGYGKSFLAVNILSWINEIPGEYIPEKGEIEFEYDKKVQFIDEIHTLNSFEWLYPLMDSEKYIFILATNEYGVLPEPLIRRCVSFIFDPYTDEDIIEIINYYVQKNNLPLSQENIQRILPLCKKNPGVTKTLLFRLRYILKDEKRPPEEFEKILEEVLGVKGDFYSQDISYLSILKTLGSASLERIISYSRIPKSVILRDIEPYLIEKGLIEITPKGRKLK